MRKELLEMPIGMMTGEQFLALQRMLHSGEAQGGTTKEKRYLLGLAGICNRFGVSHATAQKLKDGVLAPAVHQCGRKILIDEELAVKLFGGR